MTGKLPGSLGQHSTFDAPAVLTKYGRELVKRADLRDTQDMTSMPTRSFLCPSCHKPTTGTVRGTAIWSGYDPDTGESINPATEYLFVQCDRCELPVLQAREDYGLGFDDDDPAIVFPSPRRLSRDIPRPLRAEWEEARTCFESKAYTAAVVMVRRTLEGTCKENGITQRTLYKGLAELKDRGLVDGTLSEWADALRVLGNQGAHYTGEAVTREDALDALDFAEALLDHIYVFRKRFEAFMRRRKEGAS